MNELNDAVTTGREMLALPADFERWLAPQLGEALFGALVAGLGQEPEVSVRFNGRKPRQRQFPCLAEAVPWAEGAFYLSERPPFTFDPLWHAGTYYVQEASSMCVAQALKQYVKGPVTMLDLCAAPGGKSTLCRSVLPEGSLLVSNEPMRQRAQVLAENLCKWGHPDVVVTNNYPEDFADFAETFDVILTDVPCSGEGMFRKDAQAVQEWSTAHVVQCQQLQREIVRTIWPTLKPGGLLVYSTCTFNQQEDEENVAWIVSNLDAEVLPIDAKPEWGLVGSTWHGLEAPVYHFFPGTARGEGFFMAVLRKAGALEDACPAWQTGKGRKEKKDKKNGRDQKKPAFSADLCQTWLEDGGWTWMVRDEVVEAYPERHVALMQVLSGRMNALLCGVRVAEMGPKGLVPQQALALSVNLRRGAFPELPLTYAEALAYLRREALVVQGDYPKGYLLVTYLGQPLGFVKYVGGRANNLYPNEWRIRSGYTPEDVKLFDYEGTERTL